MWNLVSVRLEPVLVSVQVYAWFAPNVPYAQISFRTHTMVLLGEVGHVESCFGPMETVLVSVQDRCTACAKRMIGSGIIFDETF